MHSGETNMEIIDAHAHIYPEKIAAKATDTIGIFYDIKMALPAGTTENLLHEGKNAGISRFVVHSVATTAHQVRSINEFIKREIDAHPEFIGFITLHQDLSEEEIVAEIDWAIANNFKGIKLHPDFQHFDIDSEKAIYMYSECEKRGLSVLFHMGDDRYDYSAPERLAKIAKKFPELKIHAAHFGGYQAWKTAFSVLEPSENLYFDTSSSLPFIDRDTALRFIDKHGADKFMFGTDFPMWDPQEELDRFLSLGLDKTAEEMILHSNFEKFYLNR